MANPISTYLVGDSYTPTTPKLSLQQYDNYQIYSIVSEDTTYPDKEESDVTNNYVTAFQIYDINGNIPIDFRAIALSHP